MHTCRTRLDIAAGAAMLLQLGESEATLHPVERLLRCEALEAHAAIADAIWESDSDAGCMAALEALAVSGLAGWEAVRAGDGRGADEAQAEG